MTASGSQLLYRTPSYDGVTGEANRQPTNLQQSGEPRDKTPISIECVALYGASREAAGVSDVVAKGPKRPLQLSFHAERHECHIIAAHDLHQHKVIARTLGRF